MTLMNNKGSIVSTFQNGILNSCDDVQIEPNKGGVVSLRENHNLNYMRFIRSVCEQLCQHKGII